MSDDDFLTLKNEKSYLRIGDDVWFIGDHCSVLSGKIVELIYEYDMVVVEYDERKKKVIESVIPDWVFLQRDEAIDYIIDNNLDVRLHE